MKKVISVLSFACLVFTAVAQTQSESEYHITNWCLDVNAMGGTLTQNLTTANLATAYPMYVKANTMIGSVTTTNGSSMGGDFQVGYFFDSGNHFGIGAGIMYLSQSVDVKLNSFHVEYESFDINSAVFRQVITANGPVTEKTSVTNVNIPLVLKYNTQLSEKVGFTIDGGILYNVNLTNRYTTNASFNYEAIYDFIQVAPLQPKAIYNSAPNPPPSAWDITVAEYNRTHTDGLVAQSFASIRKNGFNVGLGVTPDSKSGMTTFTKGSIAFLLRPCITVKMRHNVYVNLGAYFMSQSITNTPVSNYMITDKVGSYNSIMQSVTKSDNTSYGLNVGLRYVFVKGRYRDRDGDGITDNLDKCPDVYGLRKFQGCPDVDGDGIPDAEDKCPTVWGLAKFHGCPDSDGDGIPDKDDECPSVPGPAKFHGCPDSDGDGIPDKDDDCPYQSGPAKFFGCPDTDGDGISDNMDWCPYEAGPIENHGCPYDTGKNANHHYYRKGGSENDYNPSKKRREYRDYNGDRRDDGIDQKDNLYNKSGKDGDRNTTENSNGHINGDDYSYETPAKSKIERTDMPYKGDGQDEDGKKYTKNSKSHDEYQAPQKERKMTRAERRRAKRKAKEEDDESDAIGENNISKPLHFEVNEWTVLETSKPALEDALTKIIFEGKDKNIIIEGHADAVGPEAYNNTLSQKRADEVKKYLIQNGIKAERLKAVGKGTGYPIGDNETEEGRRKNRRVELKWDTK